MKSLRAPGSALLLLCCAVGSLALFSVALLRQSIEGGLAFEARESAQADLELVSTRALSDSEKKSVFEAVPAETRSTDALEFVSMIRDPRTGRSRLVEVRAVGDGFPLYGEFQFEPKETAWSALHAANPSQAFAQPDLLAQLGAEPGVTLELGGRSFTVSAQVRREPGVGASAFLLGPKIWVARSTIAKTGLLERGSRVRHRLLLALPGKPEAAELEKVKTALAGQLTDPAIRIRTFAESNAQTRRFFERLEEFLSGLSFLILLLSAAGFLTAFRLRLQRQRIAIATKRAIGASRAWIFRHHAGEALVLSSLGALIGGVAAFAVFPLLRALLSAWLGQTSVEAPWPDLRAGLSLGVAALLPASLALPSLARASSLSPATVLRQSQPTQNASRRSELLASTLAAALLLLGAWSALGNMKLGAALLAATAVCVGGLIAVYRWLLDGIGRRVASPRAPLVLRYGLRNLARDRALHAPTLAVLTLAFALLASVALLRGGMIRELESAATDGRPQIFLVDVSPEERDAVTQLAASEAAGSPLRTEWSKLITARLLDVNGGAVTRESDAESRNREFRLSERSDLYPTERTVSGTWWNGPASPTQRDDGALEVQASVEAEYADRAELKLGDRLRFDLQGVELVAHIVHVRKVRWTTFQPNFFVLLRPGALEDAPFTWIGTLAGIPDASLATLQSRLVQAHPTVTQIHLRDAGEKIAEVVARIERIVQAVSGFALLVGWVLLAVAAVALGEARLRENSLVRLLGASRSWVKRSTWTEWGMVLGLASLAGLAIGALAVRFGVGPRFGVETLSLDVRTGVGILLLLGSSVVVAALTLPTAARADPASLFRSE